jgi:hypothetical protein
VLILFLVIIGALAILCAYLRKRAVRWLFSFLMVIFWVSFFVLLGVVIGYQAGLHGVQILHMKL